MPEIMDKSFLTPLNCFRTECGSSSSSESPKFRLLVAWFLQITLKLLVLESLSLEFVEIIFGENYLAVVRHSFEFGEIILVHNYLAVVGSFLYFC